MGKFYLIYPNQPQYKTELHSHTTCSDGKYTPTESKELYKKRGFSVVAFTDHDVFVPHNELTDDEFIALNAFELYVPSFSEDELGREKQVHLNFIATNPNNKEMPFYNPKYVYHKGAQEFVGKIPYVGEIEDRRNETEWLNYCIKRGNDLGFLVTYNHPVWSLSQPQDYLPLEGLFGMEVWNASGLYNAPEDGIAWREMVLSGKDVKCISANDLHSNDKFDCMTAATYVCTEDFSYQGIISALKQGNFYSSMGPTIEEISICDGTIHIKCSPVKSIRLYSEKGVCSYKIANIDEFVTDADFVIAPCHKNLFYIIFEDACGKRAWTNAYFNVGRRSMEYQLSCENPSALFLHDKMENYRWLNSYDGDLAHTYFSKRLVVDQIDEIIEYCDKYNFKQVYAQFSTSEIVGFDYIFDLGESEIKKMQSNRLDDIALKLEKLAKYALNHNVQLTFLSMLPLPHSANIYDYRNNYARSINELTKTLAQKYGFVYQDVSTALMNERGILDNQFLANPTCLTEKYFKQQFNK